MKLHEAKVGQVVRVVKGTKTASGSRINEGDELTIVAVVTKEAELSDPHGHEQGLMVSGHPEFFKPSRFAPVPPVEAPAPQPSLADA